MFLGPNRPKISKETKMSKDKEVKKSNETKNIPTGSK